MTLRPALCAIGIAFTFISGCNPHPEAVGQKDDSSPPSTEVRVSPSRVAAHAREVVSGVNVSVSRTEVIEDLEEISSLRITGTVENQGEADLSGLELSLTFQQPEGVSKGGKLVQVRFEPSIPPGTTEPVQLDTSALGGLNLGQNVTTKVTVLRKLDGEAGEDAMVINGRHVDDPRQGGDIEEPDNLDVREAASSDQEAAWKERIDGDDRSTEGDGG